MHRILTLSLLALLGVSLTGNVWGADATPAVADTDETAPRTSNMESWQESERKDNWTWFGMGYESRRSFSETGGAAATGAAGGGKASGPGGHGGGRR